MTTVEVVGEFSGGLNAVLKHFFILMNTNTLE